MPAYEGAHLTTDDRITIARMLADRAKLGSIARRLRVHRSTIKREIVRNRTDKGYAKRQVWRNECVHRGVCTTGDLCDDRICDHLCAECRCRPCNGRCPEFVERSCARTTSAPYCCNGCGQGNRCGYHRYVYEVEEARRVARERLVTARSGIIARPEQVEHTLATIKPLLRRGQSFAHIAATHADDLYASPRTLYRHSERHWIDITGMDLPRRVRYKVRKAPKRTQVEQADFTGRRHSDFLKLPARTRRRVVQIDIVEGRARDTQALLSVHFVASHFQFYILLKRQSAKEVYRALTYIRSLCGPVLFEKLFAVMLLDRGSEFIGHDSIERLFRKPVGRPRAVHVYYCDPRRSDQKGACERNHVELRKILPKSTSDFDMLNPWMVALVTSHVNATHRASLNGRTPYQCAVRTLGRDLLDALGVEKVAPDDVMLTPHLLEVCHKPYER